MAADETPIDVFGWLRQGPRPVPEQVAVDKAPLPVMPLPVMPLRVAARPQLPARDLAAEAARRALRYGRLGVVMGALAILMGATALALAAGQAGSGVQRVLVGTQSCVTVPADNGQRELYCRSDALPR